MAKVRSTAVALGLATTVLLAGGGATAAADDNAPPAAAYLVTAPNGIPSTTGSPNYWATDLCHYFADGGYWHTDVCLRQLAGASGAAIPGVLGIFRNAGNGQVAEEQLQITVRAPGRVEFGVPDGRGGATPIATFVLATDQQGRQTWVQELPNTTPGTVVGGNTGGVPDVSGASPAAQAQFYDLFSRVAATQHCAIINTIGTSTCVVVG